MISTILGRIVAHTSKFDNSLARINIMALSYLRAGSLDNVFWTLILTGSIGMAVPVIFIGYANHFFKQLFVSGTIVR